MCCLRKKQQRRGCRLCEFADGRLKNEAAVVEQRFLGGVFAGNERGWTIFSGSLKDVNGGHDL